MARFIDLHDTNIAQKVEIIIEHFRANVAGCLDGKAKAMVITSSRPAAVKYRQEFDAYIKAKPVDTDKLHFRCRCHHTSPHSANFSKPPTERIYSLAVSTISA